MDARDDAVLKNKQSTELIDVLSNDIVHRNENFLHTTVISGSGTGPRISVHNPIPGEEYYWLQTISGTSRFTTREDGSIANVTFDGFQFLRASSLGCNDRVWGWWYGGTITITSPWGTRVITDAHYHAGVIVNRLSSDFGKVTAMISDLNNSIEIALPNFNGLTASVTTTGDGILRFANPPKITITSPPTQGSVNVESGGVRYTPQIGTEGTDSFEYRIMTELGDSDTATVNIGTMDLDISDLAGAELSETAEDDPGLFLPQNDDDDNGNWEPDFFEVGFPDDDLAKLTFGEFAPIAMHPLQGYFIISYDLSLIRIWHNQDKTPLSSTPDSLVVPANTRFYVPDQYPDFELWVEGVGIGRDTVSLTWHDTLNNVAAVYDSVLVTVQNGNGECSTLDSSSCPDPENLTVFENYIGDDEAITKGNWNLFDTADGRLWNHNDHLWSVEFSAATDKSLLRDLQLWAIPFENRNAIPQNAEIGYDPTILLQEMNAVRFDSTDPLDRKWLPPFALRRGQPPISDSVYLAVVTFRDSDEAYRYRISKALTAPMSSVEINWTLNLDPEDPASINPTYKKATRHSWPVPGDVLYPEQLTPDSDSMNSLGVELQIYPRVNRALQATLFLTISDPDNELSNTGTSDRQKFDVNDRFSNGKNLPEANDNLESKESHEGPAIDSPGARLKDNVATSGGVKTLKVTVVDSPSNNFHPGFVLMHRIFEVVAPQPGNNWHVSIHDEESIVKSFRYFQGATLIRNGTRANPNYDVIPPNIQTAMLTAIRKLWIEYDRMGSPNDQPNAIKRGIFNGETIPGQGDCALNQCDDPLLDAQNIDISLLTATMKSALVEPSFLPESFNKKRQIPFVHYVGVIPAQGAIVSEPFRDVRSTDEFWVVQMISAYEGAKVASGRPFENGDNDIDVGESLDGMDDDQPYFAQDWTIGYCVPHDRGTFVFHEEIRDVVTDGKQKNQPQVHFNGEIPNVTAIVVTHEVMHRFLGYHNQSTFVTNHGIMNGVKAMQAPNREVDPELGQLMLSGIQIQYVQTRKFPN